MNRTGPGRDRPAAYLAGDRRRALDEGRELPDRVRGAGLFADISGFTPLTEALVAELGPQRGPEALSVILEEVFAELLGELHRWGGEVIYFSGDAVTCWLDGDDGSAAVACALAMQELMATAGRPVLPGGREVRLELKVAVAAGPARRFVVGDPEVQLIDVLAGRLVDDLAAAEQHARRGEVVTAPSTATALAGRLVVGETREGFHVVTGVADPPRPTPEPPPLPPLPDEITRQWLLPVVHERMSTGRGELLSELRRAVPLFLHFAGIDFDDDPEARDRLDAFVVAAQRIVDGYGGNVLQLTLGDKGAYLYAVFGSPVAHEDDAARACAAALGLLGLGRDHPVTGLRVGVAHGRVRSGTYGHRDRRTFCCLGDPVNLAARLMARTPDGTVLVSDAVRDAARDRFTWGAEESVPVKGKVAAQRVVALLGLRTGPSPHRRHALPMIGREVEMGRLEQAIEEACDGRGQVVVVVAEAGLGKSRLLAEAGVRLRAAGMEGYEGEASVLGTAAYTAWRSVWAGLLGVDAQQPDEQHLREVLEAVDPELVDRLPLLNPLLGMDLADTTLTRALDAKLRKASLEELLTRLLPRAGQPPVAIVIEDAHWLDAPSQDLLLAVTRALVGRPLLLVVTTRDDGAEWLAAARRTTHSTVLRLEALDEEAARVMVEEKARRLFGLAAAPEPLLDFVLDRGEGNPFHIEELLNFAHSRAVDPTDRQALVSLDVPDSLTSLVLSRIDLLTERPRRTVKVASVVGRLFETSTLTGGYPDLGSPAEVDDQLGVLRADDLVLMESPEPETHLFRHNVIRDVAYDSLTFAQRERLHGHIGSYLETAGATVGVLAYHFARSADTDRKRTYLVRAGDAALAAYDNAAAVEHLRAAVPLLEPAERGPVRRRLGGALELLGERSEAEEVYRESVAESEARDDVLGAARARLALGEVARKQGRYDEAEALMSAAEEQLVRGGDEVGQGEALHLAGTLQAQRGRYDDARALYTRSLEIRRRLGDRSREAALLGNLGIVAEYEGDYAAARGLNEEALALRVALDDRWAVGASLINLGMIAGLQDDLDGAATSFEESLAIMQQVGDPWMTAIAQNNLGTTMRRLGRPAEAAVHFAEALRSYTSFEDRWALAHLYEDVAELAVPLGPDGARHARTLVGASSTLRDQIGAARPPARQAELDALLSDVPSDGPPTTAEGDPGRGAAEAVCALAAQQALPGS